MTDAAEPIRVGPEDVPAFADEAEEAAWWATHEVAGPWERRRPTDLPSPEQFREHRESRRGPQRAQPILVRLDADILDRLRAMADRKGTGYQTLLKRFITERLYEEEKLGGLFSSSIASTVRDVDTLHAEQSTPDGDTQDDAQALLEDPIVRTILSLPELDKPMNIVEIKRAANITTRIGEKLKELQKNGLLRRHGTRGRWQRTAAGRGNAPGR